jgi:hypothetical protein
LDEGPKADALLAAIKDKYDQSKRGHGGVMKILLNVSHGTYIGKEIKSFLQEKKAELEKQKAATSTPPEPSVLEENTIHVDEPTPVQQQPEKRSEHRTERQRLKALDQKIRESSRVRTQKPRRLAKQAVTAALLMATAAGSTVNYTFEQDNITPIPIIDVTPSSNIENRTNTEVVEIPPLEDRELLVTHDEVMRAYAGLENYVTTYQGHPAFTRNGGSKIGKAWDMEQPMSAITNYEQIYGSLPAGMPEPTEAAALYWGDGGPKNNREKGYYLEPGKDSGRLFTDDGLWIANREAERIELLRSQGKHEEADAALYRCREMLDTAWDHWDPDEGGILWQVQNKSADWKAKAAVSNGAAAELAMQLYFIDPANKELYLQRAQQAYDWMRTNLLNPDNNLYFDRIDLEEGKVLVRDHVTYGQGPMIEAGLDLARATGNSEYRAQAVATAKTLLEGGDFYTNPAVFYDSILINSFVKLYNDNETDFALKYLIRDRVILYANNLARNEKHWSRDKGIFLVGDALNHEEQGVQGQAGAADIFALAEFLKNDPAMQPWINAYNANRTREAPVPVDIRAEEQ